MHTLHLLNFPMLELLLVLKQNNKQNKQGTCIYGLQTPLPPQVRKQCQSHKKSSYQRQPPNSGIEHLKSEECEHL